MNCKECYHHWDEQKVMCEACKRMQAEGRWKWEIDNGHRVIRCPKCGGGMTFGFYFYENPYRYCPYCGEPMITHEQIKLDVDVLRFGGTKMLTLPIKKKWYDMILSGEKKEEYREITPYYEKRFRNLGMLDDNGGWYGELRLRNGYSANSPTIQIRALLFIGPGRSEWGAEPGKNYYILDILKVKEVKKRDKRG